MEQNSNTPIFQNVIIPENPSKYNGHMSQSGFNNTLKLFKD